MAKSNSAVTDTRVPDTGRDAPQSAALYPTGLRLVIIMMSLMLGTTLMSLDTTIISVATPKISTEFHALDDVGWYGAAYGMTLCATTPIASNFYKYFNPKNVYLAYIAIFEAGSIVCASAPSSPAFIVGRAIAGLGAAGLLQGAFGILTYVCTLEMRPIFLAMAVSLFGLFASIGPVIGGAFTERVTWRWCFWLNLPIGGALFALIVVFLVLNGVDKTTRDIPLLAKLQKLDFLGVILLTAGVSCLFFALQEGSNSVPWSSSKPIGLFIGFGLLLMIFGAWQWKAGDNATIPVRYLYDRTVIWGSLYLFWDNMASYITIYYMPFYIQAALNQSPLTSGISYMSLAVPQMIGLLVGGGVVTKWGHYMPIILFTQVLCAIGAGLLTTLRTDTSTALWAVYMVLTGLGLGLGVNVPHIAVQAVMETDNDIFIANGIASFFGQLGGSLGVPIGNALLIDKLRGEVFDLASDISPDAVIAAGPLALQSLTSSPAVLQGLRQAWALAVSQVNVFLVVIICISIPTACGMKWLNIKKISIQREQEKREKAASAGNAAELTELQGHGD
ncbi:hypothetical protein MMC17_000630 [Xylographa soralifera]|nr:hypothetical protein [Xylographa soralifera]